MIVEVLVVAGGGGGGRYGGGGGAGGLIYKSTYSATGNITVTVGGGGAGWVGDTQSGGNAGSGGNSVFGSLTATGGGGAGCYGNPQGSPGASGGSGGGGGNSSTGSDNAGGSGTTGQGKAGGIGGANYSTNRAGGGGGAGAAGANYSGGENGQGGIGLQYAISGTATYYGGGGSGCQLSGGTLSGGLGGGGTGFGEGIAGTTAIDGVANTGGGGGGGRDNNVSGTVRAGNGGSGIVIVRYLTATYFSTGTYRSSVLDTTSKIVVSSISWNPSSQPAGTNLIVGIRVSSHPFSINSSTPSWQTVSNGQLLNWHGRYIQYQSTFTTTNSTTTPRLEDISITYRVKPWQEKSVTRTQTNSHGFGGGESWTWQVPVKGGTLVTITAYIRYNTEYLGGTYDKPKLTLSGLGINESISATAGAENSWEQRQLSGTPSSDGILTLKAEGFSTNPGAKFFIDDISVNQ